ncbi:MAG: tetratricopeptide repeat protein [Acidobacteria bacterium]|nr:tetratricopeptide repeat protein [Acidobacteriota bacterium]
MYQVFSAYLTHLRRTVGSASMFCVVFAGLSFVAAAQSEGDQVDAVAIFNQAQELHEKGDLNGSIKLYEKALEAMPGFPEAEFQRGMAFLALGKPDEAENSYRRAIGLRPDWTLAMTSLGVLLVDLNKLAEAEPVLKKGLGHRISEPACSGCVGGDPAAGEGSRLRTSRAFNKVDRTHRKSISHAIDLGHSGGT